ncbi:hypothetical protein IWX47DRAFT_872360 [Phyllosticta citricarpa]
MRLGSLSVLLRHCVTASPRHLTALPTHGKAGTYLCYSSCFFSPQRLLLLSLVPTTRTRSAAACLHLSTRYMALVYISGRCLPCLPHKQFKKPRPLPRSSFTLGCRLVDCALGKQAASRLFPALRAGLGCLPCPAPSRHLVPACLPLHYPHLQPRRCSAAASCLRPAYI